MAVLNALKACLPNPKHDQVGGAGEPDPIHDSIVLGNRKINNPYAVQGNNMYSPWVERRRYYDT